MFEHTIEFGRSHISAPHDFQFQLDHYVLAPESRDRDSLVQVFHLTSGATVRSVVRSFGTVDEPRLAATLQSARELTRGEIDEAREKISWHLCLKEDLKGFYDLVARDRVLQASIAMHYGAKDKASFDMFHALIDCVCAQNVVFKRLYTMLGQLTSTFGSKIEIAGTEYAAFPIPEQLAAARLEDIRACKVGYRDKAIKSIAERVVNGDVKLDNVPLLKTDEAREALMELPSVGPYTADLALIVGARRTEILHLDLFVRETLWQFYFDGNHLPDKQLREFAAQRWGEFQAYAALYLTTNTEQWADKLGISFRLKSGAKS